MAKNALQIAREQYKAGTLRDKDKQKIIDMGKEQIQNAGGDRDKGIRNTRVNLGMATQENPIKSSTTNKNTSLSPVKTTTPIVEPDLLGDTTKTPDTTEVVQDTISTDIPKVDTKVEESSQTDTFIDQGNKQVEQAEELKDTAIEELRVDKQKAIEDTKRGFALGKAKFDENKANYANYDEVNTKYNAVIDEITANMSDTGVIDESVYQSIADKYGIPIEQVKNPNRILDTAELTEEGKENLGVNKFEQGLEDSTKNFERTTEDLNNRITQTEQSYNEQMQDAQESINDAIAGATASGAASGLFRSTAMEDSMNRTKEQGAKVIARLQSARNRTVGDIQTSLSRITEDFNTSITQAKQEFEKQYEDINVENMLALNEAGLNFTGEKLQQALKDIEEEFGIKSQAVFQSYMNNLTAINGVVNENMDLVDRIAQQEEEEELKVYNEYLANDGLLLQSTNLDEIIQGVQNGTLSPESAQNLRKIMQTSIQSVLGANAPLTTSDIDNINYLLEQGYTPEQAIATMQETFEKFTPVPEIQYREFNGNLYQETSDGLLLALEGDKEKKYKEFDGNLYEVTDRGLVLSKKGTKSNGGWNKLDDGSLYNENTGQIRTIGGGGNYINSLGTGIITSYGGSHDNKEGLDIDGAIGDPITFPEELTVVKVGNEQGYGNSIEVQRSNGDILKFSHNDQMFFNKGDVIAPNTVFATIGNTGNVIPGRGGDGSHIDLVIRTANGTTLKAPQVEQYLNSIQNISEEDTTEQVSQFKSNAGPLYDDFLKTGDYGSDANRKAIEAEFGSLENFRKQAESYNNREGGPAEKELKNIIDLKRQLKSFIGEGNQRALDNSIGTVRLTLRPKTAQEKQDFLNAVNYFISGQTLQSLIDAKGDGATFGALSNEELKMLQNSASELASMIQRDSETQEVTRITGSKDKFIKNIQNIINRYESQIENAKKKISESRGEEINIDDSVNGPEPKEEGFFSRGSGAREKLSNKGLRESNQINATYTSSSGETYNINDFR